MGEPCRELIDALSTLLKADSTITAQVQASNIVKYAPAEIGRAHV